MDSSTKDQLVALAHRWDRTMVENDADAIGQFMADDWVIVGADAASATGRPFWHWWNRGR